MVPAHSHISGKSHPSCCQWIAQQIRRPKALLLLCFSRCPPNSFREAVLALQIRLCDHRANCSEDCGTCKSANFQTSAQIWKWQDSWLTCKAFACLEYLFFYGWVQEGRRVLLLDEEESLISHNWRRTLRSTPWMLGVGWIFSKVSLCHLSLSLSLSLSLNYNIHTTRTPTHTHSINTFSDTHSHTCILTHDVGGPSDYVLLSLVNE